MRENKKKENFFAKRWFFIVMVVLVAAMVITLVMNMVMPKEQTDTFDEAAWEEALRRATRESDALYEQEAQSVMAEAVPQEEKTPEPSDDAEEAEGTAGTPQAPTEELTRMEKPLSGEITKDFSNEELLYSETMQDWRVHEGIDFAAEEGADVLAVADGMVEAVTKDGMLGASVLLAHPDGRKTLYANLQEDSMPPLGTQVKTGQMIGRVGRTAAEEINDVPHLHFEVLENGKSINPHPFLQDRAEADV